MTTLRGDTIVQDFKKILDEYVHSRYGAGSAKEELVVVH
jgi:(E)-4-hydroxy-3-methylbut-2-enyl-diphosphate synthase